MLPDSRFIFSKKVRLLNLKKKKKWVLSEPSLWAGAIGRVMHRPLNEARATPITIYEAPRRLKIGRLRPTKKVRIVMGCGPLI